MFEALTARLNQVFEQLRRRGKLGDADVDAVLREVRLALLEADVHFGVAQGPGRQCARPSSGRRGVQGPEPGAASDQDRA